MVGTEGPNVPDLGATLGRFLDAAHRVRPHELVDLITAAARELGATTASIWLADHEQRSLQLVTSDGRHDELAIAGTAAGRAYISSEPILPVSGDADHAWLPLLDGVDRLGVLLVEGAELTPDRLEALRHLASAATAELVTRGQYTDWFTASRRRKRMTLAAELQWQALPPLSFTTADVSVAGMLEPAYDVGGDTFDYASDGDRLDMAILDAVGHDLEATIICNLALGAYRNARRSGEDLPTCARRLDDAIRGQFRPGSFVTGLLGTLATDTGTFRWLNAGHPLPLLVRDGRVRELVAEPRPPFGLAHLGSGAAWSIGEDHLQPGDAVLLYTDGVVEARRPGGEDFGVERLKEFLHSALAAGLAPHETLRRLAHAVVDFHEGILRDDATNLLLVWQPDRPEVLGH